MINYTDPAEREKLTRVIVIYKKLSFFIVLKNLTKPDLFQLFQAIQTNKQIKKTYLKKGQDFGEVISFIFPSPKKEFL